MNTFNIGDTLAHNNRQGKVVKVLPPKSPSPGGLVLENENSIWYVAPWERVQLVKGK